jgi:hypothetical protein
MLKDSEREKFEKRPGMDYEKEMEMLKERLRVMGRE